MSILPLTATSPTTTYLQYTDSHPAAPARTSPLWTGTAAGLPSGTCCEMKQWNSYRGAGPYPGALRSAMGWTRHKQDCAWSWWNLWTEEGLRGCRASSQAKDLYADSCVFPLCLLVLTPGPKPMNHTAEIRLHTPYVQHISCSLGLAYFFAHWRCCIASVHRWHKPRSFFLESRGSLLPSSRTCSQDPNLVPTQFSLN